MTLLHSVYNKIRNNLVQLLIFIAYYFQLERREKKKEFLKD